VPSPVRCWLNEGFVNFEPKDPGKPELEHMPGCGLSLPREAGKAHHGTIARGEDEGDGFRPGVGLVIV
jgi:hypothetical protein